MKTKSNPIHSPAPWRLGKPFNGFIWGSDPTRGEKSGANWPIANIETLRGTTRFSEEDEANARLIAAAPELLSALQECLRLLNIAFSVEGGIEHNNAVDATSAAEAAIVKATQP